MESTRRAIRCLGAAAALLFVIAAWYPERAEPQSPDLITQARQALDGNKVDEALTILEKATGTDPKNPAALAWLGSAQVRKARTVSNVDAPGWVKKGFDTLDEAVERFPHAFIVYLVRGATALRVPEMFRKAPVAVKDLNAVVAMKEKNAATVPDGVMPSVHLNLGLAYKKSGQLADARAAWAKGKRLYPSAPETQAIEQELRNL